MSAWRPLPHLRRKLVSPAAMSWEDRTMTEEQFAFVDRALANRPRIIVRAWADLVSDLLGWRNDARARKDYVTADRILALIKSSGLHVDTDGFAQTGPLFIYPARTDPQALP